MTLRSALLYEISRRRLPAPAERTINYSAYQDWRKSSLSKSWSGFESVSLSGKDVLDFGCGDGHLALFLAASKSPARVVGVDLNALAIDRANAALLASPPPAGVHVDFRVGNPKALPVADGSIDVIVAFDCLEHVMSPLPIFHDWFRVLRPGGRCLLEWYPYKGPWGPHMESLIPLCHGRMCCLVRMPCFGQQSAFTTIPNSSHGTGILTTMATSGRTSGGSGPRFENKTTSMNLTSRHSARW